MSSVKTRTTQFTGTPWALSGLTLGTLLTGGAVATAADAQTTPNFGNNVIIFDGNTPQATIQSKLDSISNEGQFSTNRYAVLFKPGTYSVDTQVGFYEDIAGLGQSPDGVVINGALTANRTDSNGNVTTNFWRSEGNLRINVAATKTNPGSPGELQWAVSQGASFRRMDINGALKLANGSCGFASGGFTSDTVVSSYVDSCSQQQWYTRDSTIGSWKGAVWNMVFSGVVNAPAQSFPTAPKQNVSPYTTLAQTPVSREKPFLYVDSSGNYNVFVPTVKTNSRGTTWAAGGNAPGYSVSISNFFIAQPTNTADQINAALASGKSLILTPGIYQLNTAINVSNPNTIVLGLGYATLVPQAGTAALTVADVDGVQVAGLLIDAGPQRSAVLFQVGSSTGPGASHAGNPTSINDVYFRIGGATTGSATTSLEIDSNNVMLDNIWAWRADHGATPTGWTVNPGDHGVVVNGNNVTALGLAVEHYEKEQTLWNGNGGETIFYQSELPYDVPSQGAWQDGSANGYPSYVVSGSVCAHQAYGLGVYSYFNQGLNIIEDNGITVPNVTGVAVHDAGTVFLNGNGQITHVINGVGTTASLNSNPYVLSPVPSYVGNGTCTGGGTAPVTGTTAIDAGGGAAGSFTADKDFVGGSTYSNGQPVSVAGVANAAPAAVYQSEREGASTYTIPGLAPGSTHAIRLHFAELYFSNAGQRVFNVAINTKPVLTNFDIVAAANGSFKAVVVPSTAVANANGQIVISFTNGSVNQPLINGIEVQ
jgi:hypothetical protein